MYYSQNKTQNCTYASLVYPRNVRLNAKYKAYQLHLPHVLLKFCSQYELTLTFREDIISTI